MPRDPVTSFRIDPVLLRRIDARAKAEGVSRTDWVVAAAERALTDTRRPVSKSTPRQRRHAVNCSCGVCRP